MSVAGKTTRKLLKAVGAIKGIETKDEDAELLERIRKNVQLDAEATDVQRELELDDLRYCDPTTQWADRDRKSREDAGRPCLTEDRLNPFLMQVCNEQRKNKPGVQVNPVDSGSDMETAEIIQGLIRHIEYSSNADTAYDTAFEWAVRVGRGFYRVATAYVDSEGFDQEIVIKRIPNPHMVFVDPAAQESDYSDMKWGGIKAWLTADDFKEQYPQSEMANSGTAGWLSVGDEAEGWMSKDGGACLVVEYYEKEFKRETIKVGDKSREVLKPTIKWVKCTAVEVLERRDIPGDLIPIVAVLGKETIQNGKRTYAGLVRAGKDPQKRHNYLLTSQVERIAFMPLATWVGPKGFMGKNKAIWQNAHKNQMAALEFEQVGDNDSPINRPELITQEAPIIAVTNALEGAEQGFKAVLGMYDANMGNRQGGESGIAIQRLQQQGDTGSFHLQDNLSRALRYEGRIILSWLPTYYDTERVVRIVGEDGTQQQVRVNGPITDPEEALEPEHVGRTFDLTTGRYDVTISAGPSYQSKRQEDRAMLLSMLGGPMGELIAQRAGDLVAKTLDSPIAKELSERLMPPDIAAKEQASGPQIPPQLKQQMDAMSQQHQAMTQEIHRLMDQLEMAKHDHSTEMAKAQLDSQTKVAIAEMNNQTTLLTTQAQIDAKSADDAIKQKLADLQAHSGDLEQLVLSMHEALAAPNPTQDASGVGSASPIPSANPAGVETAGPSAGME